MLTVNIVECENMIFFALVMQWVISGFLQVLKKS